MAVYRVTKVETGPDPGGDTHILVTAYLVNVATGVASVNQTSIAKTALLDAGAIEAALFDANEEIDFTL